MNNRRYRRNSDDDLRILEREFYAGNTTVFARLVSAYVRSAALSVAFLVQYPEAFELLPTEWQEALCRSCNDGVSDSRCPECRVEDHGTCSLTPGCPCCEDTMQGIEDFHEEQDTHQAALDHILDNSAEPDEEDEDDDEDDDESGLYECAACGNTFSEDTQNEEWAILTDASSAITTAQTGRGDEGQAMCEGCLNQAGLDLEDAVQEELEDYCGGTEPFEGCGQENDDCTCT